MLKPAFEALFILCSLLNAHPAWGLVSENDMPPPANTGAVIKYGPYASATSIGPRTILATKHGGSAVGWGFNFEGQYYTTTEVIPCPYSEIDLVIVRSDRDLPRYAPIARRLQQGEQTLMSGWGLMRGAPSLDSSGTRRYGWSWWPDATAWDPAQAAQRWGSGRIDAKSFEFMIGQPIPMVFSVFRSPSHPLAGPYESAAALFDSGGGIFVRRNGWWNTAAILVSVWGPGNSSIYDNSVSRAIDVTDIRLLRWIKSAAPDVPLCLPDILGNNALGIDDLMAFLTDWFEGTGDWDGDLSNELEDIFLYLEDFFRGC